MKSSRIRTAAIALVLAIACAVAGIVAGRRMVTPQQAAALADAPPPSLITAKVTQQKVQDAQVARGNVVVLNSVDLLSKRTFEAPTPIVTALKAKVGDELPSCSVAVEVAGRPLFVFTGQFGAYRAMAPGAKGPDVAQLQAALTACGHPTTPDAKGTWGEATQKALATLYAQRGYELAGGLPQSEVAFLPSLPAKVVAMTTRVGALAPETSLQVAAGKAVVLTPAPTGNAVPKGTAARFDDDLTGESAEGVTGEVLAPGKAGNTDGEQAMLVVEPNQALDLATWLGHNIRVTLVRKVSDTNLAVPVAAVHADGQGRTVVTKISGKAGEAAQRTDVEVRTGVVGEGLVGVEPVNSGSLAEGDDVLLGQR